MVKHTFTEDTHPSHNQPSHGFGNSASQPHFAWMEDPNFEKSFRQMDSTHESTEGYSRQYKNGKTLHGQMEYRQLKLQVGKKVQIRTPAHNAGRCKAQSRSQTLPHGHTRVSQIFRFCCLADRWCIWWNVAHMPNFRAFGSSPVQHNGFKVYYINLLHKSDFGDKSANLTPKTCM